MASQAKRVDLHLRLDEPIADWLAEFTARSSNPHFRTAEDVISFLIRSMMDDEHFHAIDPAVLRGLIQHAKVPHDWDDDIPF